MEDTSVEHPPANQRKQPALKQKCYKNVPTFEGNYAQFEREVKLWSRVTTVKKAEQGSALALSLVGTARQVATNMTDDLIAAENGLDNVLAEIKKLYEKDTMDSYHKELLELEEFRRTKNQDIVEYIVEFEMRFNKARDTLGAEPYSDEMKGFKLITNANLDSTSERIVRVGSSDWKFANAVSTLRKAFGSGSDGSCANSVNTVEPSIKLEPTFYNYQNQRGGGYRYNSGRGGGSGQGKKYWNKYNSNRNTNYSGCWNCGSKEHKRHECKEPVKKNEEVKGKINYIAPSVNFVYAENHALLDSGAGWNVCGAEWFAHFKDTCEEKIGNPEGKKREFLFGNIVHTGRRIILPLMLGSKKFHVKVYVVDCNVPLLISTKTMKDLKVSIRFADNVAEIDGEKVDLILTDESHFLIPVLPERVFYSKGKTQPSAMKLHRAFGHASADRIIKILRQNESSDEVIEKDLKKISEKCEFCARFRKKTTDPSVTANLTENFNDMLCIDLKFLKEEDGTTAIILHMIDHLSKLSQAKILRDKTGRSVVEGILEKWVSVFGPPRRILTDNGGEFLNLDFQEMCDLLGIKHSTTASYAPFANGVVERANGILGNMVQKLKADMKLKTDVALNWALQAKNCLLNNDGFSPYQLAMGYNPKLPQNSTANEEMLRTKTSSSVMCRMLNTIQKAREEYIKAEGCAKLKRAMKTKTENSPCRMYKTGDQVRFRRSIDKEWIKGEVVGQMGKTVVIMSGGQVIKAEFTSVRLISGGHQEAQVEEERRTKTKKNDGNRRKDEVQMIEDDSSSEDRDSDSIVVSDEEEQYSREEVQQEEESRTAETETEIKEEQEDMSFYEAYEDTVDAVVEESVEETVGDITVEEVAEEEEWTDVQTIKKDRLDLEQGDRIKFKLPDEESERVATIVSRSGKAHTALKNRFNVVDEEGGEFRVDLRFAESVKKDPKKILSVNVPKSRYGEEKVKEAMEKELESLKNFGTFEEVRDTGMKTLSMRWVVVEKGTGYKARLVCRGFEEEDDGLETDSPTVEKSSVRIFLGLAAMFGWKVKSVDIKAAFLQADQLDRDVFVRPPRDIKKLGTIWKLVKPLYGLSDSSRNWYFTLRSALLKVGLTQSENDKALFYWKTTKLEGIWVIHVDDFLVCGTGKFQKLVNEICTKFQVSKVQDGNTCRYIGLDIKDQDDAIILSQHDYLEIVTPIKVPDRGLDDLLTAEEIKGYQSLLGKLNWLSCNSRPDLKFDVFFYSQYNKTPKVKDLKGLNAVVKRVKKRGTSILFPKLDLNKLKIIVFSDASLGNLEEKVRSCKAFIVLISDGKRCFPVKWNCKKIDRVCCDTLESETRAMKFGVNNAIGIMHVLEELLGFKLPIHSLIDSKTLERSCFSTNNVKDATLKRTIARIQQNIHRGILTKVIHVRSKDQLADSLTKQGANTTALLQVLESGELIL